MRSNVYITYRLEARCHLLVTNAKRLSQVCQPKEDNVRKKLFTVLSDLFKSPHYIRPSCWEQGEPLAAYFYPECISRRGRLRCRFCISDPLKQQFLPCQIRLVDDRLPSKVNRSVQGQTSAQMDICKHPNWKIRQILRHLCQSIPVTEIGRCVCSMISQITDMLFSSYFTKKMKQTIFPWYV